MIKLVVKKCKDWVPYKLTAILVVAIIVFIGTIPTLRNVAIDSISAIYGSVLVTLANRDRVSSNVAELKVSPILEKAAQLKADDMASKGYFAHNTPDGKTPWYWFEKAGYNYIYAGENLAVNFFESEDVETAWMNSPTHRSNIINSKFTEVGIATSTGIYKGREAIFVVQMFGTPAR